MGNSYNPENYWDNVGKSIGSRQDTNIIAGDDEPYYRYKRRLFLDIFSKIDFTDKSVLEIGSGPGGNLDFLSHKGCKKITGVDISQQMISLAKNLLENKNIDIIKINGKELPFPNRTFDLVFTSTVLQHNTNEEVLKQLISEICRVSDDQVLLFERIESKIKGHESNLGRPISYYESLMKEYDFRLVSKHALPIQASFLVCGVIRKVFNPSSRKEGEPLTKFSILLEKVVLPVTSLLDKIIPSNRDAMLLIFKRNA